MEMRNKAFEMTALKESFVNAEQKWFGVIVDYLMLLYQNVHLPSHDISHHIRVWNICKKLLMEIDRVGIPVSNELVEQALVASLFHDTGLLRDKSERHGRQSRLICEQFFCKQAHLQASNLTPVLNAIENHDNKSLKAVKQDSKSPKSDLLTIISTADDLDAFGYIGVYRYLEIYSLRGIPFKSIPEKVISNLDVRYENFKRSYSMLTNFYRMYKELYDLAKNFYLNVEREVNSNSGEYGEYSLICKNLIDSLVDRKLDIKGAIAHGILSNSSEVSLNFLISLKDELEI